MNSIHKLFFQESLNGGKFGNITDVYVRVYVNYMRDQFQYNFARLLICQYELVECPIVEKRNYTTDVQLFLPTNPLVSDSDNGFPETVRNFKIDQIF